MNPGKVLYHLIIKSWLMNIYQMQLELIRSQTFAFLYGNIEKKSSKTKLIGAKEAVLLNPFARNYFVLPIHITRDNLQLLSHILRKQFY